MNDMCHTPNFFRLGSALFLFSILIAGCAGTPNEVRYDNRVKTYVTPSNNTATTSTVTQGGPVTAHYVLRPGNRPDFQPKAQKTATTQQPQTNQMAPETQLADLQLVLEVSDILFDFDKWVLRLNVVPELDKWAAYLQSNPEVTAEIYGYADSTGPTEYNQNLSLKRAQAVVNYLSGKGINPKRLTARGFGESQPVAPNTTSEGRQKNRRVELNL